MYIISILFTGIVCAFAGYKFSGKIRQKIGYPVVISVSVLCVLLLFTGVNVRLLSIFGFKMMLNLAVGSLAGGIAVGLFIRAVRE